MDTVTRADLENTANLLDLYEHAIAHGIAADSDAERLDFVAFAEHALRGRDPPALFKWLVFNRRHDRITGEDEDKANARLKAFEYGNTWEANRRAR